MRESGAADSTAFALERRNFDFLPDEQAGQWRHDFLSSPKRAVPGPKKLIVELLNSCNLDCPMCRVGQFGPNLRRFLPTHVLERVIAETPSVRAVRLNGLGESTLLPDFCRYIDILQAAGLSIELISNGSGPPEAYRRVLQSAGHVLISWDSVTPVTFERLRRPARWDEYVERLDAIGKLAREDGAGRLSLLFTLQKANVGELERLIEFAARIGAASVQMNMAKLAAMAWVDSSWVIIAEDAERASEAAERRGISLFLPDQICGRRLPAPKVSTTAAGRCTAPWEEVVIRWNGDVQACNMFNPYVYGNVHRAPLLSIWANEFATLFRAKLNTGDSHPYCRDCAYIPAAYA